VKIEPVEQELESVEIQRKYPKRKK